jgi:hypothetical protein
MFAARRHCQCQHDDRYSGAVLTVLVCHVALSFGIRVELFARRLFQVPQADLVEKPLKIMVIHSVAIISKRTLETLPQELSRLDFVAKS